MVLTDDQKALQESARRFARERLLPEYRKREKHGRLERDLVAEMGRLGFLGMDLPEELGGMGADAVTTGLITEELAYGDFNVSAVPVGISLNGAILLRHERQRSPLRHPRRGGRDRHPRGTGQDPRAPATVPLQRFGTEAELSAAIVYLLSPAAAYVTGTCLRVDGGGAPNNRSSSWKLASHSRSQPFNGFHRSVPPLLLQRGVPPADEPTEDRTDKSADKRAEKRGVNR